MRDFIQISGLSEKIIKAVKYKTALLRIYGEGDEREMELAHDQIAKHALAARKKRQANNVVRFAAGIAAILFVATAIISYLYAKQKEKDVNVKSLQTQVDSLNYIQRQGEINVKKLQEYNNELREKLEIYSKDKNTLADDYITLQRAAAATNKLALDRLNNINQLNQDIATLQRRMTDSTVFYTAKLNSLQARANYAESRLLVTESKWMHASDSVDKLKDSLDVLSRLRTEYQSLQNTHRIGMNYKDTQINILNQSIEKYKDTVAILRQRLVRDSSQPHNP